MSHTTVENIIDLSGERVRRVHDQHEKRLQTVRAAFTNALSFTTPASQKSKKSKKKR